jgi:PAS domain S-box-containing protein
MPINNPRHSRFFWRSSAMFGILDQKRQFKEVNSAWENTLGLSTSQLLAKSLLDFTHPDDQPSTEYYLEQLDGGIRSISFSTRFRHHEGFYRTILWEINSAASAEYAYYVVGMDITSREQPMVADEMISVLQEGVVLQYANGTIGACNPSAERILGLTADQMMGWTLIDPDWRLIHEDGSPFPAETHPAICTLRTGQSYADVVMGIVKTDESVIWIRIHAYPLWRDDVTTPYAVVVSFSDVTQYKEAEHALRKTSGSATTPEVIPENNYDLWDWDLSTNEMHFSRRWEQMLGFDEHELEPKIDSWHQRIHPADYKRVIADIQNHLEGLTQVCENTHRLQHKDGSYRWILSRAVMVQDPSGKPHRMVGTHIDITEPRSLEDELNETEKKYQQLMEAESDAVFLVDTETMAIQDANKAAMHLYGHSRSHLLTLKHLELSAQPDKMEKSIKKGMKSTSTQYHKKQDDTVFPVEVTTSPFIFQNKQVLMVVVRDISEQQKVETALWETELKYRQLFEATSNPTVVFDANTQQIFDVNQAAIDLYGYGKDEWMRMTSEQVSAEQVKKRGAFSSGNRRLIPLRWHKKRDGTVFPVEISVGNTYLFQGRSLVCATIRDITERKAHEEALRQERDFVKSLVQASPAFFVAINPDGNIRMINKAMLQATEYAFEEIIQTNFLTTFIPESEQALVSREFDTLIKSMQPSLMECHINTQINKLLLVEWHSRAVVKADGTLDYFFGVGIDVTERKKAQGHLRLFKSIIESSGEAIVVRNTEGQLIYTNPAYENLFGRGFKEAKQLQLADYYASDSLAILEQELKQLLQTGESWEGELEAYRKNGSMVPIWQRIDAVRDPQGSIIFSFDLMHDISERKRMWETLRKQWQEYQMIFNAIPALIWYRDQDNQILRQNQRAREIFKHYQEELEEYTDCQEILTSGEPQLGMVYCLGQIAETETVDDDTDDRENPKTGSESLRWLQLDKIPCQDGDHNTLGTLVFGNDITNQKSGSEALDLEPQALLRDKEPLVASTFENAKLGISLTDDRGKFILVNQSFADLYGYRPDELMGQPFTLILPPEVHEEAVREYYNLLMTHEDPMFLLRRQEQNRQGHIFDVQIMASQIVLEDKPRMLVSVVSKWEE